MSVELIEGFDPLTEQLAADAPERGMIEEATRRVVQNILKSYTGYFDVFSEMLQNALDALDARSRKEQFEPKLWIAIDISKNQVRVVDNGIGMDVNEFRFCFRPNVSFKDRKTNRGHKGVGATFLAYGFSLVRLQSKKDGVSLAGRLRQGREWTEDEGKIVGRPKFEAMPFDAPELAGERSGTSIEIIIGSRRPQLSWLQANTPSQWLDVLRMKSPLGGVYITHGARKLDVQVHVEVTTHDGSTFNLETPARNIDYYYPHDMPNVVKAEDLSSIERIINSIPGDPDMRFRKLPGEYRRLDAVYEIWDKERIVTDATLSRNLTDEQKALLEKHDISVYGFFLSSATKWREFKENYLKVRPSADLLKGGLQLASDYMIQGDLLVIPLTSTIGYQANTHIVFHMMDGDPDMGRKVFQPEIKALAEEISRRAVDIFKRYLKLMREDTGAPTLSQSDELWSWKTSQLEYRDRNALQIAVPIVCAPQSEQDTIALFHELVAQSKLKGLKFIATSESDRYDGLFQTSYTQDMRYSALEPLGVASTVNLTSDSQPYVLEYKYDFDALVSDFEKEIKFDGDVNLCICWKLGRQSDDRFVLRSYLVGDEGTNRHFFGSTHVAFRGGVKAFEIICLKDLIAFLVDPDGTRAMQKTQYG